MDSLQRPRLLLLSALFCSTGVAAAQSTRISDEILGAFNSGIAEFALTPDGTQALYEARTSYNGNFELYRVPAYGRGPAQLVHAPLPPGSNITSRLSVTPDSLRVVYSVQPYPAQFELFSAPLQGGPAEVNLRGVLAGHGTVELWSLTPDGQWLVYSADQDLPRHPELYRVPIDGSSLPAKLNESLVAEAPDFIGQDFWLSSDNRRVVYSLELSSPLNNAVTELFSVPLDLSSPPVRLNPPLVASGSLQPRGGPALRMAPGSTRVVFTADAEVAGTIELYSAPIDGSAPATKLTQGGLPSHALASEITFDITADGARVLYVAHPGGGPNLLFSVPIEGGATPTLLGPIWLVPETFELSPDSASVVYHLGDSSSSQLMAAPVDGSAPPHALTPLLAGDRPVHEYAIAPDSSRVVLVGMPTGLPRELYSVPLDGSLPPVRLSDPLPPGCNVGFHIGSGSFQISADSRGVVFFGDTRVDEQWELHSVPIDGSARPRVLSTPMVAGGDVSDFQVRTFRLSPSGDRVYYKADQQRDDVFELFAATLGRPHARTQTPAPTRFVTR